MDFVDERFYPLQNIQDRRFFDIIEFSLTQVVVPDQVKVAERAQADADRGFGEVHHVREFSRLAFAAAEELENFVGGGIAQDPADPRPAVKTFRDFSSNDDILSTVCGMSRVN